MPIVGREVWMCDPMSSSIQFCHVLFMQSNALMEILKASYTPMYKNPVTSGVTRLTSSLTQWHRRHHNSLWAFWEPAFFVTSLTVNALLPLSRQCRHKEIFSSFIRPFQSRVLRCQRNSRLLMHWSNGYQTAIISGTGYAFPLAFGKSGPRRVCAYTCISADQVMI